MPQNILALNRILDTNKSASARTSVPTAAGFWG